MPGNSVTYQSINTVAETGETTLNAQEILHDWQNIVALLQQYDFHLPADIINIINAQLPPPLDWFTALPRQPLAQRWRVYVMVLQRKWASSKGICGLGHQCQARPGALAAMLRCGTSYRHATVNRESVLRRVHVVDESGLSVSVTQRGPSDRRHTRLGHALETTSSIALWAMANDAPILHTRHLCPWPSFAEFQYQGLCTHVALNDPAHVLLRFQELHELQLGLLPISYHNKVI